MTQREGARIVAVVGAGHIAGISKHWKQQELHSVDISRVPSPSELPQFRQYVKERVGIIRKENPKAKMRQLQRKKWIAVGTGGVGLLCFINRANISKFISSLRYFRKR